MIDAASGGALVDKTPDAARALISNMAANSQQFGTRSATPMKVNEVTTTLSNVDQKITELTAFVHKLAINQITTCGVCSTIGHPSDLCPTLLNGNIEQANAMGGFQSNYGYGGNHYVAPNNPPGFNNQRVQQSYQPRQPTPPPNQGKSLEEMIIALTNSNSQFQNDTKNHLKSIENQFSQLATTVGRLEAQGSGKLPSQTVINPKENASAISLRSGKTLDEAHKELVQNGKEKDLSLEKDDATTSREDTPSRKVISNSSIPINVSSLPFPSRFATTKKGGT